MKRFSKIAFLSIALGIGLASCEKDSCDDTIPELTYKTAVLNVFAPDSMTLNLTFKFKDCDGDIGLYGSDTTGVFDIDTGTYRHNFIIDFYYLENNTWKRRDTEILNDRIPVLNEDGRQLIEGEIDKLIQYADLLFYDTIRIEARLRDRGLNESNVAETPVFIIP